MIIIPILESFRNHLIKEHKELSNGNCIVTGTSVLIAQLAQRYVQIYYSGSTFQGTGGSNLPRAMDVGVRMYHVLALDSVNKYSAAAKVALNFSEEIINLLHMRYDVTDIPLQEPLHVVGETQLRRLSEKKPVWYMDQTYRLLFIQTFDQIKT